MQKKHTFVVAIDEKLKSQPDDIKSTLKKACVLAEAYSAQLKLIFCGVDPIITENLERSDSEIQALKSEYVNKNQQWLQVLAADYKAQYKAISTESIWHEPFYEAAIREATKLQASLLIKPVRKIAKFSEAIFANADWQLMRHCPIPLLLVKARPWTHPIKLVAAIDPAHDHDKPANLDHKILKNTFDLAKHLQAEPHVIHAINKKRLTFLNEKEIIERRNRVIEKMLVHYPVPKSNVHLVKGNAEKALPRFAQESGVDIVVMGAVSRTSLNSIFVGHTAEQILEALSCDILVIKTSSFKSSISA